MRRMVLLASVALLATSMLSGCGSSSPATQVAGARSVSLAIRDNPPAGVSILSFEIQVTGAKLQPSDTSQSAVSLLTSPVDIELSQLETEKALLNTLNAPDGGYSSISLSFGSPDMTILNSTGQTLTLGGKSCSSGSICEFTPSISVPSLSIASSPFPITVSQANPIGLLVDFDVNSSVQNNLSITPSVTVAAVAGQHVNNESDTQMEDIEGVTGKVQSVGTSSFSLVDSTSGQTFNVTVNSNTRYQDFTEIGCSANNFSCVQAGQILEVEHLLVMDNGTLVASEVQLDDAVNENQLDGIVVAVDALHNTFQMVVQDEEPNVAGVQIGNATTVSVDSATQFSIDGGDFGSSLQAGLTFASANDLLVGQEVEVRALSVSSGPAVATNHIKLHTSQFTGTVASVNSPDFTVNNLPPLFTSNGINLVQVQTSSDTEFEGVSGASSLNAGDNLALRGLLFKALGGNPVLVAKKVRKP